MEQGRRVAIESVAFFRHGYDGEHADLRRERAAGSDDTAFRKCFRRDLHAGLLRNLRGAGVVALRIGPDTAALGISPAAA